MKFACRYCGFNGATAVVESDDPEQFLQSFWSLVSEKIYGLRLLVETHRHGRTIVIGLRPCGSMVWQRRRAWARLRDELVLPGFIAAGIAVTPQLVANAWDKWPMVTVRARIADDGGSAADQQGQSSPSAAALDRAAGVNGGDATGERQSP